MLKPFVDSKSSGQINGRKLIMSIRSEATTVLGSICNLLEGGKVFLGCFSCFHVFSSIFTLGMIGDGIQ